MIIGRPYPYITFSMAISQPFEFSIIGTCSPTVVNSDNKFELFSSLSGVKDKIFSTVLCKIFNLIIKFNTIYINKYCSPPPEKGLKSLRYNMLLNKTVHKWFRGNFAAEDFSWTVSLDNFRVVSEFAVSIERFRRRLHHYLVIIGFEHFELSIYILYHVMRVFRIKLMVYSFTYELLHSFFLCNWVTARYLLVTILLHGCWLNNLFSKQ